MSKTEAISLSNVSRETTELLNEYVAMLQKWNPAINLVSKASITDVWTRHISDSAQVFNLTKGSARKWVDLGSGGGLPGVVVAILSKTVNPSGKVVLVEADKRKGAFLRHVSLNLGLDYDVITERIENIAPLRGQVISARALAPLDKLLEYVDRHIDVSGTALLSKGETFQDEIDAARQKWTFNLDVHQSIVQPLSVILEIRGLARV